MVELLNCSQGLASKAREASFAALENASGPDFRKRRDHHVESAQALSSPRGTEHGPHASAAILLQHTTGCIHN